MTDADILAAYGALQMTRVPLEALPTLRSGEWYVRPLGALGTCGFYPVPWDTQIIRAPSAKAAIFRARPLEYAGILIAVQMKSGAWHLIRCEDGAAANDAEIRLRNTGDYSAIWRSDLPNWPF